MSNLKKTLEGVIGPLGLDIGKSKVKQKIFESLSPSSNLDTHSTIVLKLKKLIRFLTPELPDSHRPYIFQVESLEHYLSDETTKNLVYEIILKRMNFYKNNNLVLVRLFRLVKTYLKPFTPSFEVIMQIYYFVESKLKNQVLHSYAMFIKMLIKDDIFVNPSFIEKEKTKSNQYLKSSKKRKMKKEHTHKNKFFFQDHIYEHKLKNMHLKKKRFFSNFLFFEFLGRNFWEDKEARKKSRPDQDSDIRLDISSVLTQDMNLEIFLEQISTYKKSTQNHDESSSSSPMSTRSAKHFFSKNYSDSDFGKKNISEIIEEEGRHFRLFNYKSVKSYPNTPKDLSEILSDIVGNKKFNERGYVTFVLLIEEIYNGKNRYEIDLFLSVLIELIGNEKNEVKILCLNVIYNLYVRNKSSPHVVADLKAKFQKILNFCFFKKFFQGGLGGRGRFIRCLFYLCNFLGEDFLREEPGIRIEIVLEFYKHFPPNLLMAVLIEKLYVDPFTLNLASLKKIGGIRFVVDQYLRSDDDFYVKKIWFLVLVDFCCKDFKLESDKRYILKILVENDGFLFFENFFKLFPTKIFFMGGQGREGQKNFLVSFSNFIFRKLIVMREIDVDKPNFIKKKQQIKIINGAKTSVVSFVKNLQVLILKYIKIDSYIKEHALNYARKKPVETGNEREKLEAEDLERFSEFLVNSPKNFKIAENFWFLIFHNHYHHSTRKKKGFSTEILTDFLRFFEGESENEKKFGLFLKIFAKIILIGDVDDEGFMESINFLVGKFLEKTIEDKNLYIELFHVLIKFIGVKIEFQKQLSERSSTGRHSFNKKQEVEGNDYDIYDGKGWVDYFLEGKVFVCNKVISKLSILNFQKLFLKISGGYGTEFEKCRIAVFLIIKYKCIKNFLELKNLENGINFFIKLIEDENESNLKVIYYSSKFLLFFLYYFAREKFFKSLRKLIQKSQKVKDFKYLQNPFFTISFFLDIN